jgi:DNA-binding HxlR family transcriptional regulator
MYFSRHPSHISQTAEVGRYRSYLAAVIGCNDFLSDRFCFLCISSMDNNLVTLFCQCQSGGLSDSAGSPCDQYCFRHPFFTKLPGYWYTFDASYLKDTRMTKKELNIEQKIKYVQDTLFVISGKWKLPIMMAVNNGNIRFRDIQRAVPHITTRVLSKELKDLVENRLLKRTVQDSLPVSVTYTVTPYCKSLKPMVDEMIKWGENHRKELKKARAV